MTSDPPRREWLRATLEILAECPEGLTPGEMVRLLMDRFPAPEVEEVDPDRDQLTYRWDVAGLVGVG